MMMKSKFLNVLAVGLVTLAVISPGLITFGVVWGHHNELVKAQKFSLRTNRDLHNPSLTSVPQKKAHEGLLRKIIIVVDQYKITTIFQWFILGTPISIGLLIIAYDRYLVYRDAVLRRQIQMLERLWEQSIEQ